MTLQEVDNALTAGGAAADDDPPAALTLQQVLQEDRAHAFRFDAEIDVAPAFAEGQSVITACHGHPGHSRLPQYARGRRGTIHAHHGAHVFPDLSAQGEEIHQHCYSGHVQRGRALARGCGESRHGLPRPLGKLPGERLSGMEMNTDSALQPLKSVDGDAAFDEAWQAEALAIADSLVQSGLFSAADWSQTLGAALRQAEVDGARR